MMKKRVFRHVSIIFCLLSLAFSFQLNPSIDERRITSLKVRGAENGDLIDNNDDGEQQQQQQQHYSLSRRNLLLSTGLSISTSVMIEDTTSRPIAQAAIDIPFKRFAGSYVLETRADSSAKSVWTQTVDTPVPTLSSEYALLKVLPVKNQVFRAIEQNVEALSVLRYRESSNQENIVGAWAKAEQAINTTITILNTRRSRLEPVFNPDDSTEVAILKAERGEILIGDIKQDLEYLRQAIEVRNTTCVFEKQRSVLLNLGFLGELLVKKYPFNVPSKGKYSYLPRLLGRARVTFRFKRSGTVLGDVTIIADGYTAPITAGNFIDLCLRGFYTGLPIVEGTKKIGSSDSVMLPINVLGQYNEGFYDPLTAKLRRVPLEVIRIEGTPKLSYSAREFEFGESSNFDNAGFVPAALTSKPLLSFETPGLIAFNHPTFDPNGGSSEFFGLRSTTDENIKVSLMNGEYAPFGYIIEGINIFDSLKPGDVIDSTTVDEFGQLNLVKIRSSSFKEVAKGTEDAASASD